MLLCSGYTCTVSSCHQHQHSTDRLDIVVYLLLPRGCGVIDGLQVYSMSHVTKITCDSWLFSQNNMSNMELADRLIHVRSTVKHEKDYPSFTEDDIVFLFGDIVRPVGLILNKNDPLECFVLFPPATPMQDVIELPEVGASMQLGIYEPKSAMLTIVCKLIQGKELEDGEEYDYIPIPPLDPKNHSTPQKERRTCCP